MIAKHAQTTKKFKTVVIPAVRLPVVAAWWPKAKVTLLKADGDDPAEQMMFPSSPITAGEERIDGKIDYKVIRAVNLYYERNGTWDASRLEEIWETVMKSDTMRNSINRIKHVNLKELRFYWPVYGRPVELWWKKFTVHPNLFVPETPGGTKPGKKLVDVLGELKEQLVEQGKIPREEVHEYKNSVLDLKMAVHLPPEEGEWQEPKNVYEIQGSLGDMAKVMDIIDVAGSREDMKVPEA